MKKLFSLLCVSALLLSCKKEASKDLSPWTGRELSFGELFNEIKDSKLKHKEHAVYIKFDWNKKSNHIKITSIQERNLSFGFGLATVLFDLDKNQLATARLQDEDQYEVSCQGRSGGSWTRDCSNTLSCGRTIADCLGQGGCATICQNHMIYLPKRHEFYITDEEETENLLTQEDVSEREYVPDGDPLLSE